MTWEPLGWEVISRFTVRRSKAMGFTNPGVLLTGSRVTVRANSRLRWQGHTRATRWSPGGKVEGGNHVNAVGVRAPFSRRTWPNRPAMRRFDPPFL